MKTPSDALKKQKRGVSIPSQRRFLYYWALCLAHEAPSGFWSLTMPPSHLPSIGLPGASPRKQVRLVEIKLRLRELSPVKLGLVKAANIIIDKTKGGSPTNLSTPQERSGLDDQCSLSGSVNHIWVSLARYDDDFVNTLEQWEKHTRDEQGNMGIRKPGSAHRTGKDDCEEERLAAMFRDGRWDKDKMVRCFARMGEIGEATRTESRAIDKVGYVVFFSLIYLTCLIQEEKILTYTLRPLTHTKWEGIKKDIQDDFMHQSEQIQTQAYDLPASEAHSLSDIESRPLSRTASGTQAPLPPTGVILDAEREVRIKLYMGQVRAVANSVRILCINF
jgi:phosphatidylinositol-3,4,5-trisphosphate 3-phosphatase/dual-specificity protein phosphatase PTEN